MFATSERVSPWRARCSARSVGRLTRSCPSSCLTSMSRGTRSVSSPRGPFTRTSSGSIEIATPSGRGMGFLPIRDMALPDVGDDLAADARVAGLVAGHHAVRGGHDRGPHAAEDLRDLAVADVAALAGPRDALQAGDGRAAVGLGVLERDPDEAAGVVGIRRLELVGVDVALLAQDPGHLDLELARRDLDRLVRRLDGVAHAGEEVGDGVCHGHTVRTAPATS